MIREFGLLPHGLVSGFGMDRLSWGDWLVPCLHISFLSRRVACVPVSCVHDFDFDFDFSEILI